MSEKRKAKVHRTKEEKLRIVDEAEKYGVTATCIMYGIYPASCYQWAEN